MSEKIKTFIAERIADDVKMIGNVSEADIAQVAQDWMDDENRPAARYKILREYYPQAKKILDMASGAGGFVFYGLKNEYDAHGIEPEAWKEELMALKIAENDYPKDWARHFTTGVGEKMPYADDSFDFVSTYQTLEHVQDVQACINEMIRVTKPGGAIYIQCPNYASTFEPHYKLAWLPLFPHGLARKYLKWRGANPEFLGTLNYTTPWKVKSKIRNAEKALNKPVRIRNFEQMKFAKALDGKGLGFLSVLYPLYVAFSYTKNLFCAVNDIQIVIEVRS